MVRVIILNQVNREYRLIKMVIYSREKTTHPKAKLVIYRSILKIEKNQSMGKLKYNIIFDRDDIYEKYFELIKEQFIKADNNPKTELMDSKK